MLSCTRNEDDHLCVLMFAANRYNEHNINTVAFTAHLWNKQCHTSSEESHHDWLRPWPRAKSSLLATWTLKVWEEEIQKIHHHDHHTVKNTHTRMLWDRTPGMTWAWIIHFSRGFAFFALLSLPCFVWNFPFKTWNQSTEMALNDLY